MKEKKNKNKFDNIVINNSNNSNYCYGIFFV